MGVFKITTMFFKFGWHHTVVRHVTPKRYKMKIFSNLTFLIVISLWAFSLRFFFAQCV